MVRQQREIVAKAGHFLFSLAPGATSMTPAPSTDDTNVFRPTFSDFLADRLNVGDTSVEEEGTVKSFINILSRTSTRLRM